ncbi:MAG TPA: MaoC/PaaZ C-terminal domain-containing protein [Candidatus Limnocylindrales bacterium]|nr:MaoC/PaaZ C-terminal domain-containing protein [Candidatus Limnocylindrales bacterium]
MSLVEPNLFVVEAERTIAYARATNDPIAAHLSGELAPPVFAVVPAWESLVEAVSRVAPAEVLPQLLHGEQDIHIHRPVVPGMRLVSTAEVVGTHVKTSGTTVTVHSLSSTSDGEPVNEQYMVAFLRGWNADHPGGEPAPDHAFTPPEGEAEKVLSAKVDEDQTFRYRDASGDHNPIHVDDEIARAVGLPGMIVHGLCTMAFTSWAAVIVLCDGDPRRLKRIAVRFSQPVLPGQEITTRFWGGHYETVSDSGALVIKNGFIERD